MVVVLVFRWNVKREGHKTKFDLEEE